MKSQALPRFGQCSLTPPPLCACGVGINSRFAAETKSVVHPVEAAWRRFRNSEHHRLSSRASTQLLPSHRKAAKTYDPRRSDTNRVRLFEEREVTDRHRRTPLA